MTTGPTERRRRRPKAEPDAAQRRGRSLSPWERLGEGIGRQKTAIANKHLAMGGTGSYWSL